MTFLSDLGGFLKDNDVTLDKILDVVGRYRKGEIEPQGIGRSPAIAQVLAINSRKQAISKAMTDETDPMRRQMLANQEDLLTTPA